MTSKEFISLLNEEIKIVENIIVETYGEDRKTSLQNFAVSSQVTGKNRIVLTALYNTIKRCPNLTYAQIENFIKGKQDFRFLEKFIDTVPNAIEELMQKGAYKLAGEYTSLVFRKSKRKQSRKPIENKTKNYDIFVDDDGFIDDDFDDVIETMEVDL